MNTTLNYLPHVYGKIHPTNGSCDSNTQDCNTLEAANFDCSDVTAQGHILFEDQSGDGTETEFETATQFDTTDIPACRELK